MEVIIGQHCLLCAQNIANHIDHLVTHLTAQLQGASCCSKAIVYRATE